MSQSFWCGYWPITEWTQNPLRKSWYRFFAVITGRLKNEPKIHLVKDDTDSLLILLFNNHINMDLYIYLCNLQNNFSRVSNNEPYCPLGLTQISHANMFIRNILILKSYFVQIQDHSKFLITSPNQMDDENSRRR